jgi:hypothetical protein
MPRLPDIQRDWGITVVRVMMGIIITAVQISQKSPCRTG